MPDPMTSPSPEMKPLTKGERETLAAVATETIALESTPAFGEIIDASDVAEARWRLRYEATLAELESRVSQSVPSTGRLSQSEIGTVQDADELLRNYCRAKGLADDLRKLIVRLESEAERAAQSPAPEGATDATDEKWRYPGCAQDCPYPHAARVVHLYLAEFCDETLPFPKMIADASRLAAAALKDARHWLSISDGNYRDMERQRDQLAEEIASLKQQVIDSALRAERLEAAADLIHVIEKHQLAVAPQINGGWVIESSQETGGGDSEVWELARTRESLAVALRLAEDNLRGASLSPQPKIRDTCSECGGSGRRSGETYSECGGSGRTSPQPAPEAKP